MFALYLFRLCIADLALFVRVFTQAQYLHNASQTTLNNMGNSVKIKWLIIDNVIAEKNHNKTESISCGFYNNILYNASTLWLYLASLIVTRVL